MNRTAVPSDAASGQTPTDQFEELLGVRHSGTVELKQRLLHACRILPAGLRKPVLKTLWPPPLRHMRYVPPSVEIRPAADGMWSIRPRDGEEVMHPLPLRRLHDSVRKPAMIIATGPTANEFDWTSLADGGHVLWAVNGAPTMLEKHGLKADFLVITDHRFARDGAHHIALAARQGATLCFSYEAAAGFAATRSDLMVATPFHVFEKANAWFGIPVMGPDELMRFNDRAGMPFALPAEPKSGVGWSHDPEWGVFAGRTVVFAALQLVVWSGSREIGIIGMDLGGKARAYAEAKPEVSHLERDLDQYIRPAFQCMSTALAGGSIRITNHSRTSPLPRDLVSWS